MRMAVRRHTVQSVGPAARSRVDPAGRPQGIAVELARFAQDTAGRGNWGHPGLAKILKDTTVEEALWRPEPGAHSIWDEVNHIVYWSQDVLEQLAYQGTPRKQAWPAGEGGADDWRRAAGAAIRLHRGLAKRIGQAGPAGLRKKSQKTRHSNAQLILGCISHIAYHSGRIALLRRLYRHARQSAAPAV